MSKSIDTVLAYLEQHAQQHVEQLCAFLRIPSVSALSSHAGDTRRAAELLVTELGELGLQVELIETDGHPLVYAEGEQRPGRPTLLFYGHYDVQPTDPLDEWVSPPFEPRIVDDVVYARGASDDKGQLYCHVKALEAYARTGAEVPVNVKMIIEGEEECGGHAVYAFTEANRDKLACDAVVVSDTSLYNEQTPAICYSLRGLTYMEIHVHGPSADLHSGCWGGVVHNPANVLASVVASLTDEQGRVQVPGFYGDVLDLDAEERAAFASLGFGDDILLRDTGAPAAFGEAGYTSLERMWARPTCDVNGMVSGYTGEGAKTIIPASASAKVSMRLVPNQDPEAIAKAFSEHVRAVAPAGVRVEVETLHTAKPVLVPRDSAMMQAGLKAMEGGFGAKPVFIREGGSIPIVGTFQSALGAPVLLMGYGLPNDNIHSPNEKFHLANFRQGIRTTALLLQEAARVGDGSD